MKYRQVHYYVDLLPGWQDSSIPPFMTNLQPTYPVAPGMIRVRITVELPHIEIPVDIERPATAMIVPS